MKRWTDDEVQFLCENIEKSRGWIAEKLGRSVISVKQKVHYLRREKRLQPLQREKEAIKKVSRAPSSTLCWDCRHATNKNRVCSWADKFIPVEGWKAKSCMLYAGINGERAVQSYRVENCPLFQGDWE